MAVNKLRMVSKRDGEVVAEGVVFSDDTTVIHWTRQGFPSSTVVWKNLSDAIAVHEGQGAWKIELADES